MRDPQPSGDSKSQAADKLHTLINPSMKSTTIQSAILRVGRERPGATLSTHRVGSPLRVDRNVIAQACSKLKPR